MSLDITVLSGFLGSGKTTLLAEWLRSSADESVGVIVNEAGDIVGMSVAADGTRRAVMWRGDTVVELTLLGGETTALGRGINDKGDVVGGSGTHAVHWKISPVLAPNAAH